MKLKNTLATAMLMAMSSPVLANGGFDTMTDTATDIKMGLYGLLGVGCFSYLMYHIIMAKMGKEQWSDVLMALGHVVLAGGSLVAVSWAWNIFGS